MDLRPSPGKPGRTTAVPARWRNDVRKVLIAERQIRRRVTEMAREITRDYGDKDLVVLAVLDGTVVFLADLLRRIPLPMRLDFVGVSSYGGGTTPRELAVTKEFRLDLNNRDVLIVDDILDTGGTLAVVSAKVLKCSPRSLRLAVLLDKPARRAKQVRADYVGFVIPDLFVVGYGLDYAERYRNLPFIGVLHPGLYRA